MLQRRLANEVDRIQLKLRKIQGKAQRQERALRFERPSRRKQSSIALVETCVQRSEVEPKGWIKGVARSITQVFEARRIH